MSSEPLAHSARDGIPTQSYRDHVSGVLTRSRENAIGLGESHQDVVQTVEVAAGLHDLGKLDLDNQSVLKGGNPRKRLPVNHCDGGTAYLWQQGHVDAAGLVYSHHLGLFSYPEEVKKGDKFVLRDPATFERTDQNLETYLTEHRQLMDIRCVRVEKKPSSWSGLTRRIALSCLVDADWEDTAIHYGREGRYKPLPVRWRERLEALDAYVKGLEKDSDDSERNQLRGELYQACRDASTDRAIRMCEAPVGTGKTTAVMAHMLSVAKANKATRIFVVLPFTNIIRQAVKTYRKALTLPGENPEEIVAEHHHLADFKTVELRGMSELWRAPIVVTTAVQFFETIAGYLPARLRKLHQVPGSAIFVDEAHAAMPAKLWPQQWLWMQELASLWGCHVVLASGSLVRFWENERFMQNAVKPLVQSIIPESLSCELKNRERERVSFPVRQAPMNRRDLMDFILKKSGPRLVIMNTVQSAAVLAHEMRKAGHDVLHLSTALAPTHREVIVERVREKLRFSFSNWTLVATSCVEAGMDFDFRTAFRESASVCSLLQTAGRVNRHGKKHTCDVYDFRTDDKLLNKHPAFEQARHVLDEMCDHGLLVKLGPDEAASEAFKREIETGIPGTRATDVMNAEKEMDYPTVGKMNRVIDADTKLVVVDTDLADSIRKRHLVSARELLRNSIQIWAQKIEQLALEPLCQSREIYGLGSYAYDPDFLGYMAGVLPLVYAGQDGFYV